jgi:hypothetical protein
MEGDVTPESADATKIPGRRRSADIEYIGVWLSGRQAPHLFHASRLSQTRAGRRLGQLIP